MNDASSDGNLARKKSRPTGAAGFARLLDRAERPIYALDGEGRIVFFNRAAESWTGWEAAAMLGQVCRYHSSPDITGAAAAAAALSPPPEALAGKQSCVDIACPTPDGQLVSRRVRFVPLSVEDGNAMVAMAEDEAAAPVEAPPGESAALHERLARFRHALREQYALARIIGHSPAIERVRAQVALAASSRASVLIIGPAGSGRRHIAKSIHYGAADAGALTPLCCDPAERDLWPAALAATRPGAPSHGTLLLLDVDLAPLDLQAELISRLSAGAGCRTIATAQAPLERLTAKGEFRADLAAALATLSIELPALRERLEDLPLLAQAFLEEENARGGKQLSGWSSSTLDCLAQYAWPGNLAELAEVAREAHAHAEGHEAQVGDLPPRLRLAAEEQSRPRPAAETVDLDKFLKQVELEVIQRALAKARGNKSKAAKLLGMTRPRLYRRLVQLGLAAPE